MPHIEGLTYVKNYITGYQHTWLLNRIDEQEWLDDLKRRVQHYGYKYDYRARKVTKNAHIGRLPEWLRRLGKKIRDDGYMCANGKPVIPDQVIINEYLPGQGITPHIDCEPCFNDHIVSLSLGSACIMDFIKKNRGGSDNPENSVCADDIRRVWLQPTSLIVLTGEARYNWLHGIRARKSDEIMGVKVARERRVSLTFRSVILS